MKYAEKIVTMGCETCKTITDCRIAGEVRMVKMCNTEVKFWNESYECTKCGEQFDDKDGMGRNLDAIRRAHQMLCDELEGE